MVVSVGEMRDFFSHHAEKINEFLLIWCLLLKRTVTRCLPFSIDAVKQTLGGDANVSACLLCVSVGLTALFAGSSLCRDSRWNKCFMASLRDTLDGDTSSVLFLSQAP